LTFEYDATGQLTTVDHTDSLVDEAYNYDPNGNRGEDITNSAGTFNYDTAAYNRLTKDGMYTYLYDAEGNRTAKFTDSDHDLQ
jgi:YD repeat-containing protein